jgi:hypothetical protein
MFDDLIARLLDPAHLLTQIPYALLVLSMLMNDMGWLRAIAVSAGIIRIINRAFFEIDPVIVVWESIFVAVNVGQLLLLWYYARRHRFSADEGHFVANLPKDVERRKVRRLLRMARMATAGAGTELTREGEPVAEVMYLAEGVVQIEREGRIIAVCGPGDFLGEMSFLSGNPASATAIVVKPVRFFAFEQEKLRAALAADSDLRRAMDAGFSQNLIGKLAKTNAR